MLGITRVAKPPPKSLRRGAFLGDVDAMVSSGCARRLARVRPRALTAGRRACARSVHHVGLYAAPGGAVVFMLRAADMTRFFASSPGVMLAMLHAVFVL